MGLDRPSIEGMDRRSVQLNTLCALPKWGRHSEGRQSSLIRFRRVAVQSKINVKVREIIAGHFGIDPARVTNEVRFQDDLGADWLDRLEVIIAIEDKVPGFAMTDVVADQIDTVGDLMRVIEDSDLRRSAWTGRAVANRGPSRAGAGS
jgi:acyl carrier protein